MKQFKLDKIISCPKCGTILSGGWCSKCQGSVPY